MVQMSIFDFMPADDGDTLEGKTIAQIAADISMIVGVNFNPQTWKWKDQELVEYIAKLDKNNQLTLTEEHYNTEDEFNGQRFLGCGYSFSDHSGGGAPLDTINDAVAYFRNCIKRYNDMKARRKGGNR